MASQTVIPRSVATARLNQNFGMRNAGQIHTAARKPGTMDANQMECTNTSALGGGSHPTPAKNFQNAGTGASFNILAEKTSPPIEGIAISSLRKTMGDVLTECEDHGSQYSSCGWSHCTD